MGKEARSVWFLEAPKDRRGWVVKRVLRYMDDGLGFIDTLAEFPKHEDAVGWFNAHCPKDQQVAV